MRFDVHLIANQDERQVAVVAFHSQDLLAKLLYGGERLGLGDREHAQEAVATSKVVIPDRGVVLLAGGVCLAERGTENV